MNKQVFQPIASSLAGRCGRFKIALTVAGLALAFSLSQSARAATQYWDVNGSGTWNTTAGNNDWSPNSTGGSDVIWTNSNDAFFSSGADTQTGLTTITTTAVFANSVTFDGSNSGGYTFTNAGTLTLGNATTGNNIITLNSGAGAVTFNGTINAAASLSYGIVNNSASLLTFGGLVYDNNLAVTYNISGTGAGGVTFNGGIQNNSATGLSGGTTNINISGGGTVTINGANNYDAGVVTLSTGGSLLLGNTLSLQSQALNYTGGTFSVGSLTSVRLGGLEGSGNISLTNSGAAAANLIILRGIDGQRESKLWCADLFRQPQRPGRRDNQQRATRQPQHERHRKFQRQ